MSRVRFRKSNLSTFYENKRHVETFLRYPVEIGQGLIYFQFNDTSINTEIAHNKSCFIG